ncbi:MAG: response regulator, partial [Deltaproteobacteria bacterium]
MLTQLGYHVLTARTPGEAMRVAREHLGEIDLLMTDVIMPEMNGRDLARNLLALYPRLKRLFMSGYTDDEMLRRNIFEPGTDLVQKPFTPDVIAWRVRQILDTHSHRPNVRH